MLSRRTFFKRTLPLVALAPLVSQLSFPLPVEASPVDPGWKQIPVYPTFVAQAAIRPSWADPFGQYGYVDIKYEVHGKLYGDIIKISDVASTNTDDQIFQEAKKLLLEHSSRKLAMIEPRAYFVTR